MWTQLKPPSLRRWGGLQRPPNRVGISRERFTRVYAAVQSSSTVKNTYYDILGVEATASVDDIKSAFRRQAKLVHPDVSKSVDSEEEFKQLKEAYDVLSDSEQRAEYDNALQRAARRRSSRNSSGSGSRHVVIIEEDPWGLGGATVVVEDFEEDSDDDDSDDEGDGFLEELEYMAWAATPGNLSSSFQSSWQANARKQRRRARQEQQERAAMQAKLSLEDKAMVLQELHPQARAAAQQVFGARLQSLNTLEELSEVMEAVMEMNAMGVEFEFVDDSGGGRSTTRGSRRQGFGSAAKSRRSSNKNSSGGRGGSKANTEARRRRM
ncbi:hypothetical protein Vretimale_17606 [Volvox reticuliferus]|uniref:J domain-containing protein n=1 Tax=Volvox reticuliferus TaxID=1737510 RepID=A0A8J4FZG9_9CHLO|nr:hypothetical protein Vretifemale_18151 [Volvox reticuliferus]GIM14656.1 hypothetical protein Vretimale_17606 [Volvox reticuliferus]